MKSSMHTYIQLFDFIQVIMDISKCIICDGDLHSGSTVLCGEKGMDRIRTISINRKDGIDKKLLNMLKVDIHTKCRKDYTRYPNKSMTASNESTTSSTSSTLRSCVP